MTLSDSWNNHPYSRTAANEKINIETLLEYAEVEPYGEVEEERHAAMLLELALHPDLTDRKRQQYAEEAAVEYDVLTRLRTPSERTELHLLRASIPLLIARTTTDIKKARIEVTDRSRVLVEALEDAFTPNDMRTSNFLLGFGAQLLAEVSLRKMGHKAFPALPRHDNGVVKVDGMRYAFDVVTSPTSGNNADDEYHVQVKHRDPGQEALQRNPYHPAIVMHSVFPNSSRLNPQQPAIFQLLRQSLGMGGNADPSGYKRYQERLRKDLARHPQPSKPTTERLFELS